MATVAAASEIPQWKKDLIARLRVQNKSVHSSGTVNKEQQMYNPSLIFLGHQPNNSSSSSSAAIANGNTNVQCEKRVADNKSKKMVQEKVWDNYTSDSTEVISENDTYSRSSDSESSEELHYGPGIVNKLKNKYLSLALRCDHQSKSRPSIINLINMRKATSLENILDEQETVKLRKNVNTNRYVSKTNRPDMKRTRSMEVISQIESEVNSKPKRESMHETFLITAITTTTGNDKYRKSDYVPKLNRPRRITPVMDEREKPPADVVKQAKMIFEKKPENRTKPPKSTGEVAAKVASYKNIITQSKNVRKPVVKTKPSNLNIEKSSKPQIVHRKSEITASTKSNKVNGSVRKMVKSPVENKKQTDVSDLIEHVNGKDDCNSSLSETPDLILTLSPKVVSPLHRKSELEDDIRCSPSEVIKNGKSSVVFNFSEHLSVVNNKSSKNKVPYDNNQPLNGLTSKPISSEIEANEKGPTVLTDRVLEKNLKNVAKNGDDQCFIQVPKKNRRVNKEPESNSIVFKFTDRKDVPDYVGNDRSRAVPKLEKPKVGEGGIILLSAAALDASFGDEDDDDEILRYLKAPPSPCHVTFINDNILIDGKSSLSSKSKKIRMSISFVESGPDVFEYPSESSLLLEDSPTTSPSNVSSAAGNAVPLLTGSTLANYTPKTTETFQPGVTRSVPIRSLSETSNAHAETDTAIESQMLEETEEPVTFSAGTNSDILF